MLSKMQRLVHFYLLFIIKRNFSRKNVDREDLMKKNDGNFLKIHAHAD